MINFDSKELLLTGMIQSSTLTLFNPHELLAVIFQLESIPNLVQIQPKRGIIMQGDKKIIKIRCKGQVRSSLHLIQKQQIRLIIKGSYQSEYNHKLMIKNNIKGWDTISKDTQQFVIPIYFNFAQEISRINSESRKSQSLRNSRHMNSFQKFRESSIKKVKSSKINEDLDFILRNQEFKKHHQSRYKQKFSEKALKSNTSPQLFKNFSSAQQNNSRVQQKLRKKPQISKEYCQTSPNEFYNTPIQKILSQEQPIKSVTYPQSNNNRGFQLIVLAVIAALFLGLGQGIGNIIKN